MTFNEVVLHKILKSNELEIHTNCLLQSRMYLSAERHPLADHNGDHQ